MWVRNTVTGDAFKVNYNPNGQSIILHVLTSAMLP
jgi:hypothetical protein